MDAKISAAAGLLQAGRVPDPAQLARVVAPQGRLPDPRPLLK